MLQVERSRDGHSIAPGGFRERRRCLAVVPRHILGERGIVRSPPGDFDFRRIHLEQI